MAPLTGGDINARAVLVTLSYHLLGRADSPADFAENMVEYWVAVAREYRNAANAKRADWRPPSRTPSGTFQGVGEALKEGGFTEREPDTK